MKLGDLEDKIGHYLIPTTIVIGTNLMVGYGEAKMDSASGGSPSNAILILDAINGLLQAYINRRMAKSHNAPKEPNVLLSLLNPFNAMYYSMNGKYPDPAPVKPKNVAWETAKGGAIGALLPYAAYHAGFFLGKIF